MRAFPLTVLKGGINRLRVKGDASTSQLYDLQNGYITNAGSISPREGTIRTATLDTNTVGLVAVNGSFNVFAVAAKIFPPTQAAVITTSTGGTLTTATYYYVVTALNGVGETTASNEQSVVTTGTTSSNLLTWSAIPGALSYRVYRGTASAGENVYYAPGNVTSFTDTGAASTGGTPPVTNGTALPLPAGYTLNVLSNPVNSTATPTTIWFAKPFMGFLYVVAQFSDNNIYHYWLQSNGVWASNTVYKTGAIVTPAVPNGLAYQAIRDFPPNPTWSPETTISIGTVIEPTQYTGFAYEAVAVASDQGTQTSGLTNPAPAFLLHMDVPDYSALSTGTFPDSSVNKIISSTANGPGIITTGVKFGSGCGSFNIIAFPNAYVYAATTGPINSALQQDFTVDGWFNISSLSPNSGGSQIIWSTVVAAVNPYIRTMINSNGVLQTQISNPTVNSPSTQTTAGAVTTGTWHHFAAVRAGATFYTFLDGQLLGPQASNATGTTAAFGTLQSTLYLAGDGLSQLQNTQFFGKMDEFRITSSALWTANFTPPTGPAVTASGVVSDAHTGASEPTWPITSGSTIQEFGDFGVVSTAAGTATSTTGSVPLGKNITDRYGNSSTIANGGTPVSPSLSLPVTASTLVTTWAPGNNYAPGAVVRPTTTQGAFTNAIPNGDFENGNDGSWTFSGITPWAFTNTGPYQGNWCIQIPSGNMSAGGDFATMTNFGVVTQGQSVTASAYLNPNNIGANLDLWIQLNWYDSTDTLLSSTVGTHQEGGGYRQASVTGTAPAKAVHCRVAIGAGSGTNNRNTGYADLVTWSLAQPATVSNFLYEAVQPTAASSATAQPVWPTVSGATVIDGGVTWKAIGTSIITWQAIPLMLSGTTQPNFPTTVGLSVGDPSTFTDINGAAIKTSMSWQCTSRRITDTHCPNTNSVALGASHVFAGDKDLCDYSAAVNPTDWSSANNAGYLPTGLNNYGDNPVAMLALYRSNLMVFNAGGYQMWQIDPDPANMALLDAQPVGSIWPRAAQSVANDLLFLTEVGVRNLGTVGATANMQVGNTGQPVDPLVKAALQAGTYTPLSLYYPGRGQYWLIFGPQAFVLTINGAGQKTWSRYIFPSAITDWTLNAGVLYLRTASNLVWQFDASAVGIDDSSVLTTGANTPFNGVVQWPYADLGSLGLNKMLVGVDLVGDGSVTIQLGFDQSNSSTFNDNANFATSTGVTAPYFVAIDDTVPGEPLPIPINAPSYSLILTFTGSSSSPNAWSWEAANLYVTDAKGAGATG